MRRKRKLWEIMAPNPSVRYGMAEKLNVGHWMRVETPYGKKLQVYEHGIGKEGGTSILLRHGYTGGMRSVSHDPAEYLVEVNATTSTKTERVLFAHTDSEIVTIDGNGTVGQYSVEEVFAKIGFSGEWWYRRVVTNVTRNLGVIFIWDRLSTHWYIVDKEFNVILSGVLDGYEVDFYTYYNNKLRVLMYSWDDDTYTWAEWTKDGIRKMGFIGRVGIHGLAGRYYISRDSKFIRFADYETGDTVSYELLNRWCFVEVKSVGYNQFRVYIVYRHEPVTFRFRDLLNRLPGVGSYLSLEELIPESEAVVYEFYVNDRDVRFEGKVSGDISGGIISRKDASAYGIYSYDGHLCKWVYRGRTPPYGGVLPYAWDPDHYYADGTVLLSLNNVDYASNFTLPKDNVVIYRGFNLQGEYRIRLAVKNREVWFKGSSANDVIYQARPISFNPDTEEAYIVLILKDTYRSVYFKVTKDRIERVDEISYYQLVDFSERYYLLCFVRPGSRIPVRYIDKEYDCSGNDVKIGNYWYPGYLRVVNRVTFAFKAINSSKHLIYGMRDIVLLGSDNTFKCLICNTFAPKVMLNGKAITGADEIRTVVASDGKGVRWIGGLNGIEGEYLNDRLLFRGQVMYMGGGHNFAIISRDEDTGWVTYIADVDTLMAGECGVVLDKVQWDFYNFDAQDIFVFGTRGVKLRNVR
jgi:hypothetical protein